MQEGLPNLTISLQEKWDGAERLGDRAGLVTPDAYNSAWVALVPSARKSIRPAFPQALAYLRGSQLPDGGWGDPYFYYAHGRTISTLAALRALLTWEGPGDARRIAKALNALHRYAADLAEEVHEPIGFELLLPRLAYAVEQFGVSLPTVAWADVWKLAEEKLALIGSLQPEYERPRSWWFSMEMLAEQQLARLENWVLNSHGSIVTSPAATAAYLRALRLHGADNPLADYYLEQVTMMSDGGAGVCCPIEGFELIWTLDAYMRAGLDPDSPPIAPLVRWLQTYWLHSPGGLSHSLAFPIKDGDHTAVAYKVLHWAGAAVSDAKLLAFWDESENHFFTYPDERTPSVSANVHALLAFRAAPDNRLHRQIAAHITDWLREEMVQEGTLHDKWHISRFYATSRAILPLIGWDDNLARQCIGYLLAHQNGDGGWGSGAHSTLEETAYGVLGLVAALRGRLLRDRVPLQRAASYLWRARNRSPRAGLWIGKTLYQPIGVVRSILYAARLALQTEGLYGTAVLFADDEIHSPLSVPQ